MDIAIPDLNDADTQLIPGHCSEILAERKRSAILVTLLCPTMGPGDTRRVSTMASVSSEASPV